MLHKIIKILQKRMRQYKNNVFSENKLTFVLLMSDDEIIDICHMNIRGHFQMKRFMLRCHSDIKGGGGSGA